MLHLETEILLKSKGLRVTDFRKEVLQLFIDATNAIDHGFIEQHLGNFDRITLYRTLKTYVESGLIHEIVMPGDIKKLALCKEECKNHDHEHGHQHLHFRCDQCEEVFCLDLPDFPKINYPKFKIKQLEIQGSGVCSNCR